MPETLKPRVVLALIEKSGKFLLIKRKIAGISDLRWAFPGGIVGEAESDERAVIRHAKFEVELAIEIKEKLLERIHPDTHWSIAYYYCIPKGKTIAKVGEPHEIAGVEWVKAKEVLNKFTSDVDPEIQKFILSKKTK